VELFQKILAEISSLTILAIVFLLGSAFQRLKVVEDRINNMEGNIDGIEVIKNEIKHLKESQDQLFSHLQSHLKIVEVKGRVGRSGE
jgi:hypothetical protein